MPQCRGKKGGKKSLARRRRNIIMWGIANKETKSPATKETGPISAQNEFYQGGREDLQFSTL